MDRKEEKSLSELLDTQSDVETLGIAVEHLGRESAKVRALRGGLRGRLLGIKNGLGEAPFKERFSGLLQAFDDYNLCHSSYLLEPDISRFSLPAWAAIRALRASETHISWRMFVKTYEAILAEVNRIH